MHGKRCRLREPSSSPLRLSSRANALQLFQALPHPPCALFTFPTSLLVSVPAAQPRITAPAEAAAWRRLPTPLARRRCAEFAAGSGRRPHAAQIRVLASPPAVPALAERLQPSDGAPHAAPCLQLLDYEEADEEATAAEAAKEGAQVRRWGGPAWRLSTPRPVGVSHGAGCEAMSLIGDPRDCAATCRSRRATSASTAVASRTSCSSPSCCAPSRTAASSTPPRVSGGQWRGPSRKGGAAGAAAASGRRPGGRRLAAAGQQQHTAISSQPVGAEPHPSPGLPLRPLCSQCNTSASPRPSWAWT